MECPIKQAIKWFQSGCGGSDLESKRLDIGESKASLGYMSRPSLKKKKNTEKGKERNEKERVTCMPLHLVLGRWSRRVKYLSTCPF